MTALSAKLKFKAIVLAALGLRLSVEY